MKDPERFTKERKALLEKSERVAVTEDNIRIIAKKTGRSVYELTNLVAEAQLKGRTLSIRIPSE